ncbi:unnamed protein product [Protopolystoma xenopodis]|uniref:Uncharacterized protein n=1 Tax=Protopolystoma xenopodis TaxID=117903 RepID=A0A448XA40_9PLAT|nr:unnamed protein product [Protopolystoma xenopodis]
MWPTDESATSLLPFHDTGSPLSPPLPPKTRTHLTGISSTLSRETDEEDAELASGLSEQVVQASLSQIIME